MQQWNLIRAKNEAGLTQKDMASKLGISEVTDRHKEKGKTQFNADEIFIISKLFHKNLEEFFTFRVHEKCTI